MMRSSRSTRASSFSRIFVVVACALSLSAHHATRCQTSLAPVMLDAVATMMPGEFRVLGV
jgi:hypothetical protein